MIRKYLQPHIHNCQTHPGGAVALDLFFKSETKLRIIAVYLSSTDMHKRNETQNTIITWIQQAQQLNLHPILLGDFNTHDDINSSSSKF
jgi:endonuclease/exonuclease/phosphatase family metal-dependent hydrolase